MKITIVVFNTDKAAAFEWLISKIDRTRFELSFVSINSKKETNLRTHCELYQLPFFHVPYRGKKSMVGAVIRTSGILKKIQPKIVHCHMFEGGLIGLMAAFFVGVKNRVYTRHYSDFHHVYAKSGLKYDHIINYLSTKIVAVSEVVSNILIDLEDVNPSKVVIIKHGLPFEDFMDIDKDDIISMKIKHSLPQEKKIIGVVSRFTLLKGIQYIVPAFKKIQDEFSNVHFVFAGGKGDYTEEIHKLMEVEGLSHYTEIEFEEDNATLFKTFDFFVHTPISQTAEAFGQIYIEAILCEVPSVFTLSGIANEVAQDGVNCQVVSFNSSEGIYKALKKYIEDSVFARMIKSECLNSVSEYELKNNIKAHEDLYSQFE